MDHKSSGIEYDREMFVPSAQQTTPARPSVMAILLFVLAIAAVAALGFMGYRVATQGGGSPSAADTRALLQVQQRLSQIDDRLDRVEQENHRLAAARSLTNSKQPEVVAQNDAASNTPPRVVYRVSPSIQQPRVAIPDPATTQKLTALQQSLGAARDDASANREAWQATTDRLADVAGQVGSQHGEILRSQDDLNRLLTQTERSALPFELHRGSAPEQLGPVTVALKSTNAKNQRYTVCVYVQHSCVELRDRTLYEVVQVALSRNAPPLQVIATKVGKDGITGYLEIPREAPGR
jgi:hypothetical protein